MKKIVLSVVLAGVLISIPAVTRALSNDEALQRIAQLLAQVQLLQAQLNVIEGGEPLGPVPGFYANTLGTVNANIADAERCLSLSTDLSRGDENTEVEKLQKFLAKDPRVYPEGIVSGYYGRLTELAVQRYQCAQGIVCTGTAQSTGYGVAGPKTRATLKRSCTGADANEAVERDLVVTPTVGPFPLEVTATFSLRGSSCSSFVLDWGDGTKPLSFNAGNTATCSRDIAHKRATHTYNVPGVHQVTLRAGRGPLSQTRVVNRAVVSVGDTQPTGFSLAPTTGSFPLTTSITFPVQGATCTSYEADWGDGTIDRHEQLSPACSPDSGTESLTHTYLSPGIYDVTFKSGPRPLAELQINERWSVVVKDDVIAEAGVSVKPRAGNAPLIVEVSLVGLGESCTSYELDWGDFTQPQRFEALSDSCDGTPFERNFTHTYINPGTYSIKTKVGTQPLDQLSANIEQVVVGDLGTGTVRSNCPYPDTPVCGELTLTTCSAGYSCAPVRQTYVNQCALEDVAARFLYAGPCQ